jgi:ATP-binding cassette, subfamily C (CFTR/MRP), member 1
MFSCVINSQLEKLTTVNTDGALFQALTMSNEARKTTTVGEIVNLMSVDAQRLQDAAGYMWMIWSAPLQIAIAVYMLWQLLGISTLAGLGIMIILIPLNGFIVSFSRKYQV